MTVVLGVDACKSGWVGIELRDRRFHSAAIAENLHELLSGFEEAAAIGVDIPIGLPSGDSRDCDGQARAVLGDRRSSVFPAPPREALLATNHRQATKIAADSIGKGISMQAFRLGPKILEAETIRETYPHVFEVHPEVSFWALNGKAPLEFAKKSWNGLAVRRVLLENAGIRISEGIGDAGKAAADDLLDAAAAAWTADRFSRHEAGSFPPGADPKAESVIWF